MASIIVRICLRYIAAFLVARGALSPEIGDILATDTDITAGLEVAAGFAVGAAVEGWLFLERRFGWQA